MGSTHARRYYHFVWGTKERRNFIQPEFEPRLHAWLGGAVRQIDGVADIINGMPDHVHLLLSLRPKHSPAEIARNIKAGSSEWMHRELRVPAFGWQDGYFVCTISPIQLGGVRRYIGNQKEHHRKLTWEEELKQLLTRAGIEYDPKYLT